MSNLIQQLKQYRIRTTDEFQIFLFWFMFLLILTGTFVIGAFLIFS